MSESVFLVVPVVIGYISWYRYHYALVVLAGISPLYLLRFTVFGLPTNALEVAVAVVVIVGVITGRVRSDWLPALRRIPWQALVGWGVFVSAAIISTVISSHPVTSLGILKSWIVVPTIYAFVLFASTQGKAGKNTVDQTINALIVSGLVVALIGLSQLGSVERIQSVYDTPNSLALFLAPLIVLAVAQRRSPAWRFYLFAAVAMFLALLGSESLGGVLAVLTTLCILVGTWQKAVLLNAQYLLTVFAVLFVSIAIMAPKIQYVMQPKSSAYVRLQLWSISSELIREHPLLGVGLGDFEPFYQQKLHQRFANGDTSALPEFVFRDPHNWVYSFWLNTGLLGLIAFAGLHASIFFSTPKHPLTFALITLLLFGLVDTIFWKNDLSMVHATLLALVLRMGLGLEPNRG